MNYIRKIIAAQFSELGKNERAIAVILAGAALSCYFSGQFLRMANTALLPVNPVESYVVSGSSRNNFTCAILFGVMLLTFDAPFFTDRSIYEIAIVGKHQWLVSKILFLFLEVLLYNLFIFGFTVVVSLLSAYSLIWTSWSPAMNLLTESGQIISGIYFSFPDFTAAVSPWTAAWMTYLLNSGYCLVLALVMMICNILLGSTKGWPIAAGIHILGYVVGNNGNGVVFQFSFSLLDCALPAHQFSSTSNMDVIDSAIIFAVILLGLLLPSKWFRKRLIQ